jgi:hypothetical protein
MPEAALCAICHKRKPKRHCPGVRGEICAVCCGTEREVTVDCPFDCAYLRESRRYDWKKAQPPASLPFPGVEIGDGFLAEFEPFIGQLGFEMLRYALENPKTTDRDVQGALASMVKTYETLSSGIYYESLPEESSQVGVFRALKSFLDELQKKQREKGQVAGLKEEDVIRSLVFLSRLAAVHDNQRPRGKAFLDFLRQTYPGATTATHKHESGLIVPGA